MEIGIHLSGGLQTWGLILLFAWVLSMLNIIYEWIFKNSIQFSESVCGELSYVTHIT